MYKRQEEAAVEMEWRGRITKTYWSRKVGWEVLGGGVECEEGNFL